MPAYTPETAAAWEAALVTAVLGYIQAMTRIVGPTRAVYVAVDGVAPMAKIRQQRARRFKSAIAAAEEAAVRGRDASAPRWDSNAITPGTAFMARLTAALRGFKHAAGVPVVVSPADEAGEGEQKIMDYLRTHADIRDVVVYGLDADLIVLALLEHARTGRSVDLFREETEFNGAVKRAATGEEQYLYLHVGHLAGALHAAWSPAGCGLGEFIVDFVGAMNLLGNDFVPHGLALKINDQGIEHVLQVLKGFKSRLVVADGSGGAEGGRYDWDTLRALFAVLAANEERWMLRGIRRKLETRVGSTTAKDEEARAVARLNDRPVEWAAERGVWVEERRVAGEEKPRLEFREGWRAEYYKHGLWGATPIDVVRAYIHTLEWTLAYYFGERVDQTWYYPWLLPPLIGDLTEFQTPPPPLPAPVAFGLAPLEQLAMVLPLTSFHLLPAELHTLPLRYPHAWPERWEVFSLGRRFLWECEPLIPLVQPAQIRRWVDECLN